MYIRGLAIFWPIHYIKSQKNWHAKRPKCLAIAETNLEGVAKNLELINGHLRPFLVIFSATT